MKEKSVTRIENFLILTRNISETDIYMTLVIPYQHEQIQKISILLIMIAELMERVKPCGKIGTYLCEQMLELNKVCGQRKEISLFPHGESWCLGDNAAVAVLLQSGLRECWHTEKVPYIQDDYTYGKRGNKLIRVYDSVDSRLVLEDLFLKLKITFYKQNS